MSPARLGSLIGVLLACGLAGCASEPEHSRVAYHHTRPAPVVRHYTAPGPFNDPWGPYIRAASARFGVSEMWIRAVMTQESSGDLYQDGGLTTSSVGAMGLMQVMPETYDMLRERYSLGSDPYEPHDNIFAGTAYIREMYNIYGFPGFLAAYNAGPHQLEACLATGASLPMETVNYLSSVAPKLRPYAVASGPLAAYANAPMEMPADDLNRRSLTGQAMPAVQILSAPTLACMPTRPIDRPIGPQPRRAGSGRRRRPAAAKIRSAIRRRAIGPQAPREFHRRPVGPGYPPGNHYALRRLRNVDTRGQPEIGDLYQDDGRDLVESAPHGADAGRLGRYAPRTLWSGVRPPMSRMTISSRNRLYPGDVQYLRLPGLPGRL